MNAPDVGVVHVLGERPGRREPRVELDHLACEGGERRRRWPRRAGVGRRHPGQQRPGCTRSASATVLCIFQLPAMYGVRRHQLSAPSAAGASAFGLASIRDLHAGQVLALDQLQRRSAARARKWVDVGQPRPNWASASRRRSRRRRRPSCRSARGDRLGDRAGARRRTARARTRPWGRSRRPCRPRRSPRRTARGGASARCPGPSSPPGRRRRRASWTLRVGARTRQAAARRPPAGSTSQSERLASRPVPLRAGSRPSSLVERHADLDWPWAVKKGKLHGAADQDRCRRRRGSASSTPTLSVTFDAAERSTTSGRVRSRRGCPGAVRSTSRWRRSPAALGQEASRCRRVEACARCAAPNASLTKICRRAPRSAPASIRVVLGLAREEADVLEHHHGAVARGSSCSEVDLEQPIDLRRLRHRATRARSLSRLPTGSSERSGVGLAALGPAEVREASTSRAAPRSRRAVPASAAPRGCGRRRRPAAVRQRDVEVDPDDDATPLDGGVDARRSSRTPCGCSRALSTRPTSPRGPAARRGRRTRLE